MYKRAKNVAAGISRAPTLFGILNAPEIIERIRAYQEVRDYTEGDLARKLNLEGLRDSDGKPWTHDSVKALLRGEPGNRRGSNRL